MDFIRRAYETISNGRFRNLYEHLFERAEPTSRQKKIPPLIQDNNDLKVSLADERPAFNLRSVSCHDEICNVFVDDKFSRNRCNEICNFLTRDYSAIFKKCGNAGQTVKENECQNSRCNSEQFKSKESDVTEADVDLGNVVRPSLRLCAKNLSTIVSKPVSLNGVPDLSQDYSIKRSNLPCMSSTCCDENVEKCESNERNISKKAALCTAAELANRNSRSALSRSKSAGCTNESSLSDYLDDFLPSCRTSSDAGNMKFCLQYFASIRQLRVSLFNAESLEVGNCRLVTEVALVGSRGQTKRKCFSKKSVTRSNSVVFNECVYLKLKREDFAKLRLRIKLCKVSRRFRSPESIGGVILLLDEVNLNLDTAVNVILSNPELNRQIINGKYIQISRDATIEEEVQNYMNEAEHTFPRSRSLFAECGRNIESYTEQ